MTPAESVIAKMRDWLANPKPQEAGTTRILAFPESDVRAMLEHIDAQRGNTGGGLGRNEDHPGGGSGAVTPLGGKLTRIDLAKEAEKLKT